MQSNWTMLRATLGVAGFMIMLAGGTDLLAAAKSRPLPCGTPPHPCDPAPGSRPVDLVICLDTSGSMTALIDSARAKLWDVVNELSRATPTPRLRVGLLTYGTPRSTSAQRGWVVRQTDLTGDLDTVYGKMMAMRTNGGDEYVGWVLNDALCTMSWSNDPNALKIIFVAGNESADQAVERYNFRYVAEKARGNGIVINSIYAGERQQGINEHWHEVAAHGGGHFTPISMQKGTVQISTPYDDVLNRLNAELNDTYVAYGAVGEFGRRNQLRQDEASAEMGVQTMAARAAAKSSPLYSNSAWDLVDRARDADFKLEEIAEHELPAAMKALPPTEKQAYLDSMIAQRTRVQKEIQKVNEDRRQYLKKAREGQGQETSLDEALLAALRKQATDRGFVFKDSGQ